MSEKEFLELLKPLETYLTKMAVAIMGNRDEGQDALQEGLLSAFVARNQLRDKKLFKPWIKRIVAHQCSNQLKKRKRVIPMGRGEEFTFEREDLNNKTDKNLIWDVVQQLPYQQAQVLTLRYMVDLSQKEMAKFLEVPEGTVKSRLHRALGALREILNEERGGKANEM